MSGFSVSSLKLIVLTLAMVAAPAVAQPPAAPNTWALLISVKQHTTPRLNLKYTLRDTELVRKTLQERAGIASDQIVEMSDGSPDNLKPTLANLRRAVPELLSKVEEGHRLIVFFSGHGVIKEQKAYLVPNDLKTTDIPGTGYPIQELREALAKCKAKTKFLILDCCHSGGADRAVEDDEARPAALARSLEPAKLAGTVVIASSSADQKSWEWHERQQGIFTYWLCRALEGGADANGDGRLSFEEVYNYTQARVQETAMTVLGEEQTPVRLVSGDIKGTPELLTLLPEPPETVCRRLAEQIDLEVRRQKNIKKVGVLEFVVPLAKVEGLARANLPAWCAERLRASLGMLAGKEYQVLSGEQMQNASKGVTVEALGDRAEMQRLAQRAGGMEVVVTGTIKRRGTKLHVQCDLIATASGESLVSPTAVIPISEEIAADNGVSFDNRTRPNGSPYAPEVVEHVQQQAQQQHPLVSQEFPFRIEIDTVMAKPEEEITAATKRVKKSFENLPGTTDLAKRELVIGARKDEIIELRVKNNMPTRVAMTLLVDGVNTLGGKRERLGEAWSWVLDKEKEYRFEGWYFPEKIIAEPGKQQFKMNRFLFKDVAPVAGRTKFGDAPGVITAAFYAERGRDLKLDKLQRDEERHLQAVDFKPGRLLSVVHIRYVDADDLKKQD